MNHAKLMSEAFKALERYERRRIGMKAGRELDALIAEKVMDWNWVNVFSNALMIVPPIGDKLRHTHKYVDKGIPDNMPHYSTNIADAWRVVEKLQENDWEVIIETRSNETEVKAKGRMGGWIDMYGIAETAPLAICLAALKACGVIIDG